MSRIRADRYTNREGTGAPTFTDGLVVGTGTSIKSPAANTLIFDTNSVERVRITSDGNVGINTITIVDGAHFQHYQLPGRHQSFQSTNGDLAIITDNNSNPAVYIKGTGTADLVNVFDNTTEVFTIKDGGKVGIGTDTSGFATRLIVGTGNGETGNMTLFSGTSSSSYIHFADGNSGADRYRGYVTYQHSDNSMLFGTNDVERLRITSGGQFIFNSGAPSNQDTILTLTGGATTGSSVIEMGDTVDIDSGQIAYYHSVDAMAFRVNAAERARIDAGGDLSITDGNLKLGAGRGIDFSANSDTGRTVTANVLDDYEEGTWTPSLTVGGSSSGIVYSQQVASYTRIGRFVTCYGSMILTNKGSGSGGVEINGLPFTVVDIISGTSLEGGGLMTYQANVSGIYGPITVLPTQLSTKCTMYCATSSAGGMGGLSESNISNTLDTRFKFTYQTNT